MPMTDDEARTYITEIDRRKIPDKMVRLLRHHIRAIEDRAALVERLAAICERQPLTVGEPSATSVLAAARRHMKGEE